MFASLYVGVLETEFSHALEESPVVHPLEGPFNVSIGSVYVVFLIVLHPRTS